LAVYEIGTDLRGIGDFRVKTAFTMKWTSRARPTRIKEISRRVVSHTNRSPLLAVKSLRGEERVASLTRQDGQEEMWGHSPFLGGKRRKQL